MTKPVLAPPMIGLASGTPGELADRMRAGVASWSERAGADHVHLLVVVGLDRAVLEDIKRVVQRDLQGGADLRAVRRWLQARTVNGGTFLTEHAFKDFSERWADRPVGGASITVRVFVQCLRRLGVERWRDPVSRRRGFRGFALGDERAGQLSDAS